GGMAANDAIKVLRDRIEAPLHRPITLRADGFELESSAWDLGYRVDVRAAVRRAMGDTGGTLPTRIWRRVFSSPERIVAAKPKWQKGQPDAALAALTQSVALQPVDATLDSSSGWVRVVRGKPGRELDIEGSRDSVQAGVTLGDSEVRLITRDVPPAVGPDAFRKVILIRTGENTLYLYENGSIAKQWPVATGKSGYATPTGHWKVMEKIENPVWYNPGSAWARGMPAVIGPGPNNPLGTRALALDAPAILIHATSDRGSIGYGASHGCIRMIEEHEKELFERVDVGTPVVVVAAGEPKPRGTVVLPGDPAQAAAVQF
ncbi:MAG: L,D-transpeptidase/peptidoglycan binding protein, partial [Actinomycetota bacterium]|nr:L,D-transpeptidase/peptidoglycan binding protein [Actinomycetota bacterium]